MELKLSHNGDSVKIIEVRLKLGDKHILCFGDVEVFMTCSELAQLHKLLGRAKRTLPEFGYEV